MARIAIIGAGSDIAMDLIPRLEDHELFCFDRSQMDVSCLNQCRQLLDIPKPDILINFAGILAPDLIHDSSIKAWHNQIKINLLGSYNVARVALEANLSCKLIFIGSKAADSFRAGRSSYCASKAGLNAAVKCWILEGLDVWLLNIGPCATKMRDSLGLKEDPRSILSPGQVSMLIIRIIDGHAWERIIWYSQKCM